MSDSSRSFADTNTPLSGTAGSRTDGWPHHLRPGALRWARASGFYDATIAFYRDVLGLPVLDEFRASYGEDGTIFGLPDTGMQLEIIRAPAGAAPAAGAFDQLVLYLEDGEAVTRAVQRLADVGFEPRTDQHAYWAANGAVTYDDPDGRSVVFAPWVYGRDPEPANAAAAGRSVGEGSRQEVVIREFSGDRAALRGLFEEAEDSATQLNSYQGLGRVLVAQPGVGPPVGHAQVVPTDRAGVVELKNMAVLSGMRGRGLGRSLVEAALRLAADSGASEMLVGTATADVGNLRFYQRCGFRFVAVERDVFTTQNGYPSTIEIDGIQLRDRVWLARGVS